MSGGADVELGAALVAVMLIVPDAQAAVSWYRQALGARELWNLGGVAGLEAGGAPFFVQRGQLRATPPETDPGSAGLPSTRVELFVDDPDAVVARALAAGARPGSPVIDHAQPWGRHRQGSFRDTVWATSWPVGKTARPCSLDRAEPGSGTTAYPAEPSARPGRTARGKGPPRSVRGAGRAAVPQSLSIVAPFEGASAYH